VLRHLILAREPLGRSLCTAHNLRFLHRLVEQARRAIETDAAAEFFAAWNVPAGA
jgi:tRNA-guanine family transglycosylase